MLIAAILAFIPAPAAEYRIVEIERQAAFAGKLGKRVHESLILERDGQRYRVSVSGDYHTMCVRPWQLLHEGDTVRIPDARDGGSVGRDQIRRVSG